MGMAVIDARLSKQTVAFNETTSTLSASMAVSAIAILLANAGVNAQFSPDGQKTGVEYGDLTNSLYYQRIQPASAQAIAYQTYQFARHATLRSHHQLYNHPIKQPQHSPDIAIATTMLAIVNLLVVCGNVFVLYVLISQKALHTSTNFIVLSLTISDFMLGVLILPFSIFQEYSIKWMFGVLSCEIWLALDVLLSTASIYNLLAISFDRYMAVKQPIKYRYISSNRMTKFTIAIVWMIASILALPPLVMKIIGYSSFGSAASLAINGLCTPMTSSNEYIIFSAFVSFVLPMFLMILLNFSIFHTVSDSTKLTKVPISSSTTNRHITNTVTGITVATATSTDDVDSLLRIHRGGRFYKNNENFHDSQRSLNIAKYSSMANSEYHKILDTTPPSSRKATAILTSKTRSSLSVAGRMASLDSTTASVISAAKRSTSATSAFERNGKFRMSFDSSVIAASDIVPTSLNCRSATNCAKLRWLNRIKAINRERCLSMAERPSHNSNLCTSGYTDSCAFPPSSSPVQPSFRSNNANNSNLQRIAENAYPVNMSSVQQTSQYVKMEQISLSPATDFAATPRRPAMSIIERLATDHSVWYQAVVPTLLAGASRKSTKMGNNANLFLYPILSQNHREIGSGSMLRTELRVARTITVVVGCFVVCWLPFAVIYLLQAYQTCPVGVCVPNSIFIFAFWLGYSNSALNPLLYAAFSRDFRSAFRKVLMDRTHSFRGS